MPLMFLRPFSQQRRLDILHQDMDVVDRPHALERHPVLEPHHPVLSAGAQALYKKLLDELGHRPPALGRHVADRVIGRDRSARPHDDVGDARGEAVGPVIDEHAVVGRVRKRRVRGRLEGRRTPGLGQTVGKEEVGYAAIFGFGLGSPLDVAPKIGRLPLEAFELVVFWTVLVRPRTRTNCYRNKPWSSYE